jgi:Rhomboid family/Copper binding proteins, plastocyanin/azurin family
MFLYGSWDHILGNLLFLAVFGKNVEDAFGPLRYLAFYFAGGFVATMAQTLMTLAFGLGKVTFVFKNVGQIAHDFAIAGKSTPVINPGQTATLTVTFTKAGSYPYACTVPGHAAAGMKGVLRVS